MEDRYISLLQGWVNNKYGEEFRSFEAESTKTYRQGN